MSQSTLELVNKVESTMGIHPLYNRGRCLVGILRADDPAASTHRSPSSLFISSGEITAVSGRVTKPYKDLLSYEWFFERWVATMRYMRADQFIDSFYPVLGRPLGKVELALDAVLTPKELEVAEQTFVGCSSKEVAMKIGRAEGTVRKHRENISAKFGGRTDPITLWAALYVWKLSSQILNDHGLDVD